MRELLRKPIWPLVALLLLNLAVTPSFFAVRVQDGRLYGSLVDILHNGAPLALTALGMTLVIATRGIDLSVGAVVAISGAVICTWIAGSPERTIRRWWRSACSAASGSRCATAATTARCSEIISIR